MVTSVGPSSFYVKAHYQSADENVIDVPQNIPQTLFIKETQVLDFHYAFNTYDEEKEIPLKITLDSPSAQLYLYMKTCSQSGPCLFKSNEVVTNKQLFAGNGLQFDESIGNKKEINLKLFCGKKNAVMVTNQSSKVTQYRCLINIGVYGYKTPEKGASFEILLHNLNKHVLVKSNVWGFYRMVEKQTILLQYNFQRRQFETYRDISFKVDLKYGDAEVFISKKNQVPCNDQSVELYSNSLQKYTINDLLFFRHRSDDQKLQGTYYVCIVAKSLTSIGLYIQPEAAKNPEKEIEKIEVQNLPNNEALTGQINRAGGMVFFSFHADIEKTEDESIQINLTPIKGKFRIFVSSNGILPSPTQDYWNVVGESLSLRPGDKFYQKLANYVVGVQAIVDKASKVKGEKFMFNIAYSFSSRHLLLRESVAHISEFTAQDVNKPQFLRIEIPSDAKTLTFIRSSFLNSIIIAASFGDANPYPDRTKSNIVIWQGYNGFHVSEKMLKAHCSFKDTLSHCVLFVSVTSSIPVKYSVAYFTNDKPLVLHQGFPSMFPVMLRTDHPLHYLYFVQDGVKTLNFQISGSFQQTNYFVKIFDKEDLNKLQFPVSTDKSSYNLTGTSGNDFTLEADKLLRKDNQIIAISVYPSSVNVKNSEDPYYFYGDGKIEISSNDKSLIRGTAIFDSVAAGQTKYYRVHHTRKDNIVISIDSIVGVTMVFVAKGLDRLPSYSYNLFRGVNYVQQEFAITPEMMPPGQTLEGDYIVAVKGSNSNCKYQIIYQAKDETLVSLQDGVPTTVNIKSGDKTIIEFFMGALKSDTTVTFRSNYAKLEVYAIAVKWGEPSETKPVDPPSKEHYTWHTSIASEGGFARLFISKDDPAFCTYCKYIMLVEANRGDKISVLKRERNALSRTSIIEGKTYMEELKKGEADVYELTLPFNETEFSIDLRIRRGNLTFYYTMDPTFTNKNQLFVLPEKTKDEYFNINFGKLLFAIREALGWTNKRYIKIEAQQDSDYELIIVSNNMVTELKPLVTKQSTVSTANSHFYYASANVNEPIELSFRILNILNLEVGDFQRAVKYLNKFVKVYSVDTVNEAFKRKYKYQYKLDYQIYHHELRISFLSKGSFIVFQVINPMSRPVIYSLELFRSGLKMLESTHQTADLLPNFGQKTFVYDVTESMKIAWVEINQCLGSLKATYAFQSNAEKPDTPLKWERFYDSQLAKTSMDLREKGKLMIRFEKDTRGVDDGTASQGSASQLVKDVPVVFSLNFHVSDLESSPEVNTERNYLIGDKTNYGNVEIYTDRDQTIKFNPLQLHDENLYQTHHVMINYTLFMSKTEQMIDFMKSCDGFEMRLAEEAFGTTNHYSYSLIEEHRGNNVTLPVEYAFKPRSLSFGGIYHGILVADIRISKMTDDTTFPKATTFRVYYSKFAFEPADFSITLVFLFTFIGIAIVALLLWVMARNKLLDGCQRITFFKNVLGEFDSNEVGDGLVLQVLDYKKTQKRKERSRMTNLSADDSGQQLDTSTVSNNEQM